jgi:hypothetical protein
MATAGGRRPRGALVSDDRPPRVLHLLEPAPPDATPSEQLAVAVRRYADLTGRCLCGAERELASADAEGRAIYVATTEHEDDCPAVCTSLPRPARRRWERRLVDAEARHLAPVLEPQDSTCDFCGVRSPRWRYPCADFVLGAVVRSGRAVLPASASAGPWNACAGCHALIEADDREGLAAAVVPPPGRPPGWLEAGRPAIRRLHDAFLAQRGEPEPWVADEEAPT